MVGVTYLRPIGVTDHFERRAILVTWGTLMADEEKQDDELELDLDSEQPVDQPDEPETEESEDQELQPEQPESGPEQPVAAQDQVVEQPQRPSRRDSRIQSLVESNRQKDTELSDVRRRLDELTRTVQQPRQQAESPEQRAQRRALMTPQEQMQEDLREATTGFNQQLQTMQAQNVETADRTAFQAKCASNPLYAKYAPKVEGKLAELRVKGINAEREVLLKYLIGEAALDKYSSKEGKKEVRDAQQRVKRATVRPSNSGSDTAATRRREESLERRLENLNI